MYIVHVHLFGTPDYRNYEWYWRKWGLQTRRWKYYRPRIAWNTRIQPAKSGGKNQTLWFKIFYNYISYTHWFFLQLWLWTNLIMNIKRKGTFQFCFPGLLGIHRNPNWKECLKCCESLLENPQFVLWPQNWLWTYFTFDMIRKCGRLINWFLSMTF